MTCADASDSPNEANLGQEINRILAESGTTRMSPEPLSGREGTPAPVRAPANVTEDSENVYVELSVPGLHFDSIRAGVLRNVLRVAGETNSSDAEEDSDKMIVQERAHGPFSWEIPLPARVDAANSLAYYKDGLVEFKLPKLETEKWQPIDIFRV